MNIYIYIVYKVFLYIQIKWKENGINWEMRINKLKHYFMYKNKQKTRLKFYCVIKSRLIINK